MLGQKQILAQENFLSKTDFGLRRKILGIKIKNVDSKRIWVQKSLGPKKLSIKKLGVKENFGSKKKFGLKKNFRRKKIWSKKIVEKISRLKKFLVRNMLRSALKVVL